MRQGCSHTGARHLNVWLLPCWRTRAPAGGRSGPTYSSSRPQADLWAFDLASRAWQEVRQPGLAPLPRFLNSYAQYTPAKSQGE